MRDIPIVFPISLAIILAMLIFTSAYAISADAVAGSGAYSTPAGSAMPVDALAADGEYTWYQEAALFV